MNGNQHDLDKIKRARGTWRPSGPTPAGDRGDPRLRPGPEETLDMLCGDWRIFQLRQGNRYSQDDILTAWFAIRSAKDLGIDIGRILDLGTGIGTVGMILAWKFPAARLLAVEVQPVSAALTRRSILYNGIEDRAEVRVGDLRDQSIPGGDPLFDLVTATPPYIPPGRGVVSSRPQCGPSRFEMHGDVEDYCAAATRSMTPGALFVLAFDNRQTARIDEAAASAGLVVLRSTPVVPKEGKDPLFRLFTLRREDCPGQREGLSHTEEGPLIIRDRDGKWSEPYREARRVIGFPPGR